MLKSPYAGQPEHEWPLITQDLVAKFPIPASDIISVVELAWDDIYSSNFGDSGLRIGRDIFIPAQATGVILEKLIVHKLSQLHPEWRGGIHKFDKDVVCETNHLFSFEIKTSSSKNGLYGNRSTGHISDTRTKYRTGYYLVINYKLPTTDDPSRNLWGIRFGWIDDEDWIGQDKPTGQQASIGAKLAKLKLVCLRRYA